MGAFSLIVVINLLNRQNMTNLPKAGLMILPGNGCTEIRAGNWYGWLADKLQKFSKINCDKFDLTVICETMPDPFKAREVNWVPFIKSKVLDEDGSNKFDKFFIVGHSSGSVCAMRLLETVKCTGVFLVSPCVSDLGEESETVSGYYPQQMGTDKLRPWEWNKMKENSDFVTVIGSQDDPFIPIEEMRVIRDELDLEEKKFYYEFTDRGHFMNTSSPEILKIVQDKILSSF